MWVSSLGWEEPLEEGMALTPVFLPGEFYRQRSLAGYGPWGHKESNTTEATQHSHKHVPIYILYLLRTFCVANPVRTILYVISYLSLTTTQGNKDYDHPQLTNEENESEVLTGGQAVEK